MAARRCQNPQAGRSRYLACSFSRRAVSLQDSTAPAFGPEKGVARVSKPVDHCIEVVLDATGDVNALHLKGEGGLPEKLLIIAQAVESVVDAGLHQLSHHLGARLDFDDRPHRLTYGNKLSPRLAQPRH